MLPYKVEENVVVDPNFKGKLHFGSIPDYIFDLNLIATIKEMKYMHNLRCNVYGVLFIPDDTMYWFLERELT